MGVNGRRPPLPTGGNHSRKPPPPRPHTSNGRMCRLGQVVGAVILAYLLAAVIGIVTA